MDRALARGLRNEQRALQALKCLKKKRKLVLDYYQATPYVDALGVDIFVVIALPGSKDKFGRPKKITVPVQIKSSKIWAEKWKDSHRLLYSSGALVFYLPRGITDRKIRKLLYRGLDKVARNSKDCTRYHALFLYLFRNRDGNAGLERCARMISETRKYSRVASCDESEV